jgi:hypothetical protein
LNPDLNNIISLERIKKDLKEQTWLGSGSGLISVNKYILPDMKQITVSRETGYDREALAYLYFNSEIIKDMENTVNRSSSSRSKDMQKKALLKPLEKMQKATLLTPTSQHALS